MISEDVRRFIEVELQEDEELLWHEFTPEEWRVEFIKKSIKADKVSTVFSFLWIAFITSLLFAENHSLSIPLILVLSMGLLVFVLGSKSFYNPKSYYDLHSIKAYALTNMRFLTFDKSGAILQHKRYEGTIRVENYKRFFFPNKWKTIGLLLSPIGDKCDRVVEVNFLPDLEVSKENILAALKVKQ